MKRLSISVIALILSIALCFSAIVAWFLGGSPEVNNVEFGTGLIDITAELYQLQDTDFDGVPDVDDNGEAIVIRDELGEPLSVDNISILNAMPGNANIYRLNVVNNGEIDAYLHVYAKTEVSAVKLNDVFTFSYYENGVFVKKSLASNETVEIIDTKSFIAPKMTIADEGNVPGLLQLDFVVKFEDLETLKTLEATKLIFANVTNLNNYKSNTIFDKTKFMFEFIQMKNAL